VAPAAEDGRPEGLLAYAERRIKTAIADGSIGPGSRLSPHLLAPEFGLSHIPVREALASLAAAGYVDHKPGRGYMVRQLSSEDLTDIYHWRQVLEREAYLMGVPKLTDADIAEMTRLVDQMSTLTSSADRLEYVQLNREFHFVAFRRAGSERLLRFLNSLWDAAAPYSVLEMTDSSISHADHVALLPVFAARDADAVIAAMVGHRNVRVKRVVQWEADQQASLDEPKAVGEPTAKAKKLSPQKAASGPKRSTSASRSSRQD
jgi:DNA-binding GntR family transcriptional regulator